MRQKKDNTAGRFLDPSKNAHDELNKSKRLIKINVSICSFVVIFKLFTKLRCSAVSGSYLLCRMHFRTGSMGWPAILFFFLLRMNHSLFWE